jgi:hypothetical protein
MAYYKANTRHPARQLDFARQTMYIYFSLRSRRNFLYGPRRMPSSQRLDQLNQLNKPEQVLVAKETAAAGHCHKRIFRRNRCPACWNNAQLSVGIIEVDPFLTPIVAIRNQLELLASQRMVRVDDFKSCRRAVVMRCS